MALSQQQAFRLHTQKCEGTRLSTTEWNLLDKWKKSKNKSLKRTKAKRRYFHVSLTKLHNSEKTVTLRPRDASSYNEPSTARICVAPSPAHCLSAIFFDIDIHVYGTTDTVYAFWPYWVADSSVTREKWLRTETKFTYLYSINLDLMPEIIQPDSHFGFPFGVKESLPFQKKVLRKLQAFFSSKKFEKAKYNL